MEFLGTKEKWSFDGKEKWFEGVRCFEVHFGADEECVAEIIHNKHDALLISKAPELLELLSEICNHLAGEQECEEELEKGLGIRLASLVINSKALIKQSTEL